MTFERGEVQTPAFMPVGTYGTVKGMTPEDVRATGAHILLGNTFHLWLRPGTDIISMHGDLHDFMDGTAQFSRIRAAFRSLVWVMCEKLKRRASPLNRRLMATRCF